MDMKKSLALPITLAAVLLVCGVGLAQDATPFADASTVFAQMSKDTGGAVEQPIMHAPAGDVLAAYIVRTSKEMYSNQDELLIVISGHGTANVGYPKYDVKPGSVVSIPRNTAFQIIATGRSPIKAYVIASPNDDPGNKRVLEP
jgi:mannose-6-phosphate isomerase-like protein (cupin superfamily)